MQNRIVAATFCFLFLPALLFAADFTGRVVGISDGDTISVMHGTRAEKIRLNGIDCPEKRNAPGGQDANEQYKKIGLRVSAQSFGPSRRHPS